MASAEQPVEVSRRSHYETTISWFHLIENYKAGRILQELATTSIYHVETSEVQMCSTLLT